MFFNSIGTTTTAASGFPIWAIVVIVVAAVAGALLVVSAALVIMCVCCRRGDASTKILLSENGTVDGNGAPPVLVAGGATPVPVGPYYQAAHIQKEHRPLPRRSQQAPYPRTPGTRSTNQPSTEITSGNQGTIRPTVGLPAGQLPFTVSQLSSSGSGQYKQYPNQAPDDTRSIESGEYQNPGEYINQCELDPTEAAGVSATGAGGGQSEGEE